MADAILRVMVGEERTRKEVGLILDCLLIALYVFQRQEVEIIEAISEFWDGVGHGGLEGDCSWYQFCVLALEFYAGQVERVLGDEDVAFDELHLNCEAECQEG